MASRTWSATSRWSTNSSTRRTACHARRSRRLFREETRAIEVIKWRDLYQALEDAIDAAEDAAEAIERMFHKAT